MSTAYDPDGHTRTALPAYLSGVLDATETDAVEAHLAGCPDCLAECERIGPVAEQLSLLPESDADGPQAGTGARG